MRFPVWVLGLVAAALLGVGGLAYSLLSGREREPDAQSGEGPQARQAPRRRSVPRFQPLPPPSPGAPQPPPPSFVQAPAPPAVQQAPPDPQRELRERASKDGYLFREKGTPQVYVVQKGTKFLIGSQEELRALGYSPDRVEDVPAGSLNFLRDRPPDRVFLKERDNPAVFYIENGQKRFVPSPDVLLKHGSWSDVRTIPSGSLVGEAAGAPMQ